MAKVPQRSDLTVPPVTLRLIGPVAVIGPMAQDLTPRSMKGRGMMAVLGVSRGLKQPRARLQDLLYSDRGAEQGAASIRQLLREIRQALGQHRDALITGPGWVGLDEGGVAVDLAARQGNDGRLLDFAADLDIADPEFEDWLRDTRLHFENRAETPSLAAAAPASPQPPRLAVHQVLASDPNVALFADMVMMEAAVRASDLTPIIVLQTAEAPGTAATPQADLMLRSRAGRQGERVMIAATLAHAATGQTLWAQNFSVETSGDLTGMHRCASDISLAVLKAIESAMALDPAAHFPLADIFSYSLGRLQSADTALARVYDRMRPAVALSLRAFIRNTMIYERLGSDTDRLLEEANEFSTRALEMLPNNATVLAVAALVASNTGRPETELRLAGDAVRADPLNPLAILAQSQVLSDIGRDGEAVEVARQGMTGNALTALSPATWLLRRSVAAFRHGDLAEAQRHFQATHELAPDNRPALRFLAALLYHRGDHEGARQALLKLKRVEPDFSLDLMASDTYPVDSLRAAGLLSITKSGLL